MSKVLKLLAVLALMVVMSACGLQHHVPYTNVAEYPYRYTAFDYKYAWKTTTTDQGVVIDGVMKNVRYAFIDSLHVTVSAKGKDGRILARATTFPMPQFSSQDDVCHFSLLLRDIKPAPGDVYKFRVHYTGNEGGNNSGIDWYSSFKVDASTGAVIRPPGRNPDEW